MLKKFISLLVLTSAIFVGNFFNNLASFANPAIAFAHKQPTELYASPQSGCSHVLKKTNEFAPTCTENGLNIILCEQCGEVLESSTIPFLNHSFGDWIEIAKPNSRCDGMNRRECVRCGEFEEEIIPYVFVSSSPEITLSYEYVKSDEYMPYGLITPSSAEKNDKTPLIISLHGMGERGCNGSVVGNRFVAKAMQSWTLDGFNAYVLFPHLSGNGYSNSWNNEQSAKNVFTLIDYIIEKYNIDTDKIIIQGQSMGGYGCLYMAAYKPDFFSAVVAISPYNSNADLSKLNNVAFRSYVGTASYGEDSTCVEFAFGKLANTFGSDNIFQRKVSHDEIPTTAFTEDLDGDNKSDLIEWMLNQTRNV